jgi:hypothetical protein
MTMRNRFDFGKFFKALGIFLSFIGFILGGIFTAYYEDFSYMWLWAAPVIIISVWAGLDGWP